LTALREGRSSVERCEIDLGRILQSEEPVQVGLTRVANLVNTFKQLAVEPSGETRRLFFIQECLRAAQAWFSYSGRSAPATLSTSVSLEIAGPEDLELDSYPWTLTSLLISLMSNSLVHAFADKSSGTIRLEVEDRGDSMALSYFDDGVGMEERVRDHIWEPFFTTERSTGHSGLGLHIVYHQVTGLLGGTIACSSAPGEGVVFELVIPKAAPAPSS
jgi:signal transduction histidine kinase